MEPKKLLRVEEVAELLGVHRCTVFELLRKQELPVLRIGRAVRIPRKALDKWIDDNTEEPASIERWRRVA
jgi:putative molybdopterin biosynthesis protein